MMVVNSTGRVEGTIGGGAIEGKSIAFAKELIQSKESKLNDYALNFESTSSNSATGMICGGNISVYFSYIDHSDTNWISVLQDCKKCFDEHINSYLKINISNNTPSLTYDDSLKNTVQYTGSLINDTFVMPLPLNERAVVFGGGHVARSLVPVLSSIGFDCVVFENREDFAKPELFPTASKIILGDYNQLDQYIDLNKDDYYIVMTNGHAHDYIIEKQLLQRQYSYIGVMGSRKKIATINAMLIEDGITAQTISSVHTPIGLPIKAVTPEEIAISVAAECIQVRANLRENNTNSAHSCPSHL